MAKQKIYLGLTTTPDSNWKEKIQEIKEFGLKEIAVFPTFLNPAERINFYKLLAETPIEYVPFVHIRVEDTNVDEINYFKNRYGTKFFNTHSSKKNLADDYVLKDFRGDIFVENIDELGSDFKENVDKFAGVCLDIAHWEDFGKRQGRSGYKDFESIVNSYKIGLCHISGVMKEKELAFDDWHYSTHKFKSLDDFDYVRNYTEYLPEICALEVENTLLEQLKAKEYIERNLLK